MSAHRAVASVTIVSMLRNLLIGDRRYHGYALKLQASQMGMFIKAHMRNLQPRRSDCLQPSRCGFNYRVLVVLVFPLAA